MTPAAENRQASFAFEGCAFGGSKIASLEKEGVGCLPVVGMDRYRKNMPNDSIPFHVHPGCLEMSLCLNGNLRFICDGNDYPFRPGCIFVAGPENRHRLAAFPKHASKFWLLFRIPRGRASLLGLSQAETQILVSWLKGLPHVFHDSRGDVKSAFSRVWSLCRDVRLKGAERRFLIRHAALTLLLAIVEAAKQPGKILPVARLRDIMEEMRENPGEKYPLADVSARVGFSIPKLIKVFKYATGCTPHAFLQAVRIEKAKEMLSKRNGGGSSYIASVLGFSSVHHFSTEFKAATGHSPRDFRGGAAARLLPEK